MASKSELKIVKFHFHLKMGFIKQVKYYTTISDTYVVKQNTAFMNVKCVCKERL